jgi:hypothetical protein
MDNLDPLADLTKIPAAQQEGDMPTSHASSSGNVCDTHLASRVDGASIDSGCFRTVTGPLSSGTTYA